MLVATIDCGLSVLVGLLTCLQLIAIEAAVARISNSLFPMLKSVKLNLVNIYETSICRHSALIVENI